MPGKRAILGGQSGQGIADVDPVARGLVAMDEIHRMIHRGLMFTAGYFTEGIADDASLDILVVTGAGQSAHMRFEVAAGGLAEILLYEGVTMSNDGTGITAYNRRRSATQTAAAVVSRAPTVSALGTQLFQGMLPGGEGGHAVGGAAESFSEWILKSGTKYLLRTTNRSGQAQAIGADINFYEPE